MINHFYNGEIIITYWNIDPQTGQSISSTDEMLRNAHLLSKAFLHKHSSKALNDIPKGIKYSSERFAYLREHNIFVLNLACVMNADNQMDYTLLGQFAQLLAPLSRAGVCHPFSRIHILGHGGVAKDSIDYKHFTSPTQFSAKQIPLTIFAEVIRAIWIGPFGIYRNYNETRISNSFLRARISIVSCYSSSGCNPHTSTSQELSSSFANSIAGKLNHLLRHIPIPNEVVGRIFSPIPVEETKWQTPLDLSYLREQINQGTMTKWQGGLLVRLSRIHDPALKKIHTWDLASDRPVHASAEYSTPSFERNLYFDRIYNLLILLQKELSLSGKPKLFKEVIDDILEILDGIPRGASETSTTCLQISIYLRAYINNHMYEIGPPDSEIRKAFNRILAFFQRPL